VVQIVTAKPPKTFGCGKQKAIGTQRFRHYFFREILKTRDGGASRRSDKIAPFMQHPG